MKNILIALDLKSDQEKLLAQGETFAKAFNAKLWLVHVAAPNPDFAGYEAGPQSVRDFRAEELKAENKQLTELTNQLASKAIDAEGLLIQGATVETILEEAQKLNTDLIMIGHAEHSMVYKMLFGTQDTELIKKSTIPVLVVPFDKD
tara:strand:+ start:1139 stop:1579 length:441 start_codon:yes stop_codon:yes gene_type:complete